MQAPSRVFGEALPGDASDVGRGPGQHWQPGVVLSRRLSPKQANISSYRG